MSLRFSGIVKETIVRAGTIVSLLVIICLFLPVVFPLSTRIWQASITNFAKNEVSISFNNLCLNSVLELSAPFYREFSTADIISFIFSI